MKRVPMSKIKEVLRLKYCNQLSNRNIQTICGISKSAVSNYCIHFDKSGLMIDEALTMRDAQLKEKLYPELKQYQKTPKKRKPEPNWEALLLELKKKGVTRELLHQEYKEKHPEGYGLSQFKHYLSQAVKKLNPSMRQIHYAGDKLFVDFSGLTMPLVNQKTGEVTKAQIFVAVLGASGYTFVHAVESQSEEDFIECHNRTFNFFGGVPNSVVPDNLKAAVIFNRKNELRLNESYADMARHYSVAVLPARPYRPKDKAKVEAGVKGIQRWILAKLRHHTFFSIDELNEEINTLLDAYNDKVIKRIGKSRTELFEIFDKEALSPLRANVYCYRQYKRCTVDITYHIEIGSNGYSVPHEHLGKKVDVWYSNRSVTISHEGQTLAVHPRMHEMYLDSTKLEHMPPKDQYQYEKWNPGRILNWAKSIGEHTVKLMQTIMKERSHPVRGYKSCIAILNHTRHYSNEALEKASKKALELNTKSVASVESILKYKRYNEENAASPVNNTLFNAHENVRGSEYFAKSLT